MTYLCLAGLLLRLAGLLLLLGLLPCERGLRTRWVRTCRSCGTFQTNYLCLASIILSLARHFLLLCFHLARFDPRGQSLA